MDVKCPGCFNITTVFSHAQTVVLCGSCSTVLCQPTGGKARLTEGRFHVCYISEVCRLIFLALQAALSDARHKRFKKAKLEVMGMGKDIGLS